MLGPNVYAPPLNAHGGIAHGDDDPTLQTVPPDPNPKYRDKL